MVSSVRMDHPDMSIEEITNDLEENVTVATIFMDMASSQEHWTLASDQWFFANLLLFSKKWNQ